MKKNNFENILKDKEIIDLKQFKRFDDLTMDLGEDPRKIIAVVGQMVVAKFNFDAFEDKMRDYRHIRVMHNARTEMTLENCKKYQLTLITRPFICLVACTILHVTLSFGQKTSSQESGKIKPKISFTFDDGSTNDFGEYKLEIWNQLLLDNLKKHNLRAILFSSGFNKETKKGNYVLSSWNNAGHLIANHTYSHSNFNSKTVTLKSFESELIQNDTIINKYSNYFRYFRFPYLKEGNTEEKVNGFRQFLKQNKYKNGHVTIDASDWYIDSRLVKRLKETPKAAISGFKDYYKDHLLNRAVFYDSLAFQLTNRRISHVILLHHNLAAALFLDDLIKHFEANGWEVMNADKAYQDDIYKELPDNIPAGESLIWALAKKSGKFEKVLRYPAEDGIYEKPFMDKLGL